MRALRSSDFSKGRPSERVQDILRHGAHSKKWRKLRGERERSWIFREHVDARSWKDGEYGEHPSY